MNPKALRSQSLPRDPEAIGPEATEAAPRGPGSPADLEAIRARLLAGLDRIESLVRERLLVQNDAGASLAAERAAFDEARGRFLVECERWEGHRQAEAEALEHDRRLLAAAWERLEQEQIRAPESHEAQVSTHRSVPVHPGYAPPVPTETPGAVSQAVFRQFEALRRDVRKAQGHRHG